MVRILTDSACDLSPAEAHALNIQIIPLHLTLEDGTVLRDGVDTNADSFYTLLAACKKLPVTSQPSPDLFAAAFDEARAAGDEVIVILLSSALSGTYQSARIALGMSGCKNVHLLDSGTVCIAEGLLVRLAVRLRRQGYDAAQIHAELERAKKHLHVVAVIDDLKYLRKGGRLPAAVAVAGGMLGIKPLITIQDGRVVMAGRARGLPGAYVALFKAFAQNGGIDLSRDYVAGYSDKPQQLEPISRYFEVQLKAPAPIPGRVGCVIGTHAGVGAFGVAWFDAAPDNAPDAE